MKNYLNVSIPPAVSGTKITKVNWGGLERRQYVNTGTMSNAVDISFDEYPYLTPSKIKARFSKSHSNYSDCRGVFGFDDKLIVIYAKDGKILFDYYSDTVNISNTVLSDTADSEKRSVVLFNVCVEKDIDGDESTVDVLTAEYVKKLLIFPDKKSMDFEQGAGTQSIIVSPLGENFPNIKYAVVHNSRLFGVDKDKIYASGFNDYSNWTLDTIDNYSESNAWVSTAQSNVKASGEFVGITAFQNHVICFKNDYMHEIYNNKNPFRVQDIYAEGTIDQRSIQDVGGMLIFSDRDYIKVYTGGQPRILSYELNVSNITTAVSGNDGRKYYIYCVCDDLMRNTVQTSHLFVYDTTTQLWSEESLYDNSCGYLEIQGFAKTKNGFFAVVKSESQDGYIFRFDNKECSELWEFETDIMTNGTVDIKHLQKIQIYGEFASFSSMEAYMLYDGIYGAVSEEIADNEAKVRLIAKHTNNSSSAQAAYIRFIVPKSAHSGFKLKFKGSGYVKLYQMELIFRQGGERNNDN